MGKFLLSLNGTCRFGQNILPISGRQANLSGTLPLGNGLMDSLRLSTKVNRSIPSWAFCMLTGSFTESSEEVTYSKIDVEHASYVEAEEQLGSEFADICTELQGKAPV